MYVERIQIRESMAVMYPVWIGIQGPRHYTPTFAGYEGTQYSGNITAGSCKRIKRAVDLLLQLSPEEIIFNPVSQAWHPFRINFITLTISDIIIRDPKEVFKMCMVPMLQWLRDHGIKHYIWKAELQARGQVHYHITTNKFILWTEIKDHWNKLQRKAGYLKNYVQKEGHYHPNSIDVHAVNSIKDIGSYLTKYIAKNVSKNDPTRAIPGKVWDCSNSLKSKFFSTEADYLLQERLEYLRGLGMPEVRTDHCLIFKQPYKVILPKNYQRQYHLFLTALND